MRIGRIAVAGVTLALTVAAWRAQTAFQFATPRLPNAGWMLAATAGLFVLWLLCARRIEAPPAPLGRRAEWLVVLALCGLGAWFRLVHFASVPEGMNHDAAFNGMFALNALQGAPYTPYISAAWGRETLFMYLCTALVWVFGNVPEPIQLAATLVGIATLPIFYLMARAVGGQRLALLALGLLAVSGWHGVFSRVGWRMIMVPPFEMLALLGLWRGLAGWRWGWVLAGCGAAGAIYTYDAGRMVPVMVGTLLVLGAVVEPRRWKERGLGAVVVAMTFLIVGAPMLYYAATHFEQFKARASHLAEQRESEHTGLAASTGTALAMFHYRGNGNDFFINEPLLEPLPAVLFGLGLLIGLSRMRRPPERFLIAGFALALLPGMLAIPNGNRCITVLPFVYLFAAIGAAAVLDLLLLPLAQGSRPAGRPPDLVPAALLASLVIAVSGWETYREFLGPESRRILGFSAEATAAGGYLRQFDQDRYARYVVAEDWPEYTLAYLSYNGGGTPMENHYLLGRRLEDISERINRYGRKGLVFATDLKPAGRAALERLERLFADHRVEPILAARQGGRPIGAALIVEPQGAAHTALWSNTTRALVVGGDTAARGTRCFDAVGGAGGVTLRFQLMRPTLDDAPGGGLALLGSCPAAAGRALLNFSFTAQGLEASGRTRAVLLPRAQLEAGRWYDVVVAIGAAGETQIWLDRQPVAAPLAQGDGRLAGIAVSAPPGARFYLDDVIALPGAVAPDAKRWHASERPAGAFDEDFEAAPLGLLAAAGDWSAVDGALSALASPARRAADQTAVAVPADAGNAFDGGHGPEPGHFDQPMGIAVDAAGELFVADRNNHRIQVFGRDGNFKRAWGAMGSAPGEFKEPHDVAVDDEFVYVADTWNQRIQGFAHDGTPMFAFRGQPSLSSPRGVAVAERRIYVAESGAGRVTAYDRDGHLLQTYGGLGSGPGQLIEPTDVAIDAHGDVWVLNTGNNRIEHFAADGRALGAVAIPGWTGNHMKEVYLALDGRGTLYVGDWDQGAVRRFRPDGSELPPLGAKLREASGLVVERDRVLVAARAEDVVHVLPLEPKSAKSSEAD